MKRYRFFRGNFVKKTKLIKHVGILIVVLIVSIQMFRLFIFDMTAVNITNVGRT